MTQDDAVRKAMACLRLAKSSNQAEAALAASKAQEIIDAYKLDINSLDFESNCVKEDNEPIRNFADDPIDRTPLKESRWALTLASVVARSNQCKVYYSNLGQGNYVLKIIGRPSDVNTVRYIYAFLKSEVIRLCKENTVGNSGHYKWQYSQGVVDTIRLKLAEQKEQTVKQAQTEHGNNPLALVRVNNAVARMEKRFDDVIKWTQQNVKIGKGRSSSGPSSDIAMNARAHGQRDGKNVRFTSAKAGLGRGVAGALS